MAMSLAADDLSDPVVRPTSALLPLWNVYVGISPGLWMWLFVPPALLILVFPDGRLPGPKLAVGWVRPGDRAIALPVSRGGGPGAIRAALRRGPPPDPAAGTVE